MMRKMVQENARSVQDQADYNAKYGSMSKRYEKASTRLAEVGKDIAARNTKRNELEGFLRLLDSSDKLLAEFDESLWLGLVHQVRVDSDGGFTFVLKNGSEFTRVASKTRV